MFAPSLTTLDLKILPECREKNKNYDFLKKKVELVDLNSTVRWFQYIFYFQFNLCGKWAVFSEPVTFTNYNLILSVILKMLNLPTSHE